MKLLDIDKAWRELKDAAFVDASHFINAIEPLLERQAREAVAQERAQVAPLIDAVREWQEAKQERNRIGPNALPRLMNAEAALAAWRKG